MAHSKTNDEIIVSSDLNLFKKNEIGHSMTQIIMPNNEILEVTDDCQFSFSKIQKAIAVPAKTSTFAHIMHEEIVESIDAVDRATDFGAKFISAHQVLLGGFEKAKDELEQIEDLII